MNTYLRTGFIKRVMESLTHAAPRFEEFGQRFVNHMLGIPLNHRGLNVLGHSVGYTVDTYDDKGLVAAEYSAQQDYFAGNASKPMEDVLHVLHLKPQTKDIFLISADDCSPAVEEALVKRFSDWPGFVGRTVHIYNRRRIAEFIVDHLLISDLAVDQLGQYLPVLKDIASEHEANLLAPKPALGYRERDDVDKAILLRLKTEKCLCITGLGGIGKSQAATAYADALRNEFELVIWLDGTALVNINDLHSIALGRSGVSRNVAGLLRSRRCLLVIDDLAVKFSIEEIAAYCGPNSRVIITQRERVSGGLEIPFMDESLAKDVLNHGIDVSCDDGCWTQIWKTVNGHPLTLGLMNAAVRDGANWTEIAEDCVRVGEMEDGRYQRLADRLLQRFQKTLANELSTFHWLASRDTYRPLLNALIGGLGIRKLENHSMTVPSRQSVVRLHDVVYAALGTTQWLDESLSPNLTDALDKFLLTSAQSPSLDFRAAGSFMRGKLELLVRTGDRRSSFLYALLQEWLPSELNRDLIGDPSELVTRLEAKGQSAAPIETGLILESIEGLYRADKDLVGVDAAKEILRSRIELFDRLGALTGLTERQKAEILHHKGKTLSLLEKKEDAQALFEQVIQGAFPLFESRLQLVRLYGSKARTKALEQATAVLEAAKAPGTVSNSVVLATICAVPSGPEREDFMEKYSEVAQREILEAADVNLGQAFEAFAAVSRTWKWRAPKRFVDVWNNIQAPEPNNDTQRFIFAELYQNASTVLHDQKDALGARALSLYEEMASRNDFQSQQYAQALVETGRFGDALTVISTIGVPSAWAYYWKSVAQLGLDPTNAQAAMESIDTALKKLPAASNNFLPSFLAQRFEVRARLNDSSAIEDLDRAIDSCKDERYRNQLVERRNQLP